MYILGHLGFALLLLYFLSLPFLWGLLGSQMPDLIDKPLLLLNIGSSGRYMGHTLLILAITAFTVHLITKNYKHTLSYIVGYSSHFLGDIYGFLPLFYPFKHYEFPIVPFRIHYTLPFIIADILGFLILVFMYFRNKRFRTEVDNFVKTLKGILVKYFNLFSKF